MKNRTEKTCPRCERILPVEAFDLRKPLLRYLAWLCRDCSLEYKKEYRNRRRDKLFNSLARDISRARKTDQIQAIVGGMLDRFGGINQFCNSWHNAIDEAKPGGRVAFQHLNAILRLVEYVDANQPRPPENMTDADLEEDLSGYNQIRGVIQGA